MFYIYSLSTIGESDRAFRLLRCMIPGPEIADYRQRGQLPVFIPNYYRGAFYQHPRTAGRSSQLFNTGTVSCFYRCLVEGLFGLKGDRSGLTVRPQLPARWQTAKAVRRFRGATFVVTMRREPAAGKPRISLDGQLLSKARVDNIESRRTYDLQIVLPPGA